MKLFEYIFFRVAKYFYKRDGSTAIRAIGITSYIQAAIVVDVFLMIRVLFLHQDDVADYVKYGRLIGGILALTLLILNYIYFRNKYWKLSDRWREVESKNSTLRKIRGWLVTFAIVLPFAWYILIFIFC